MRRMLLCSDLHCGHRAGLTPPSWQYSVDDDPVRNKFAEVQAKMWNWWVASIEDLRPIHTLVVVGDAIDGKGEKSGGTELLTTDRKIQVAMAAEAINWIGADKVYIIKGTRYHTGEDGEDWEEVLADNVNAVHCGYHEWISCEGVMFDLRHFVGGSSIPHGRTTALSRAQLWNALWNDRDMQPKADVIVRAHRHFYINHEESTFRLINLPAMQFWTKFGSAIVEGCNDVGFVYCDCHEGSYECKPVLMPMAFAKAKALQG
jgi:hypothetical protein